MSFEAAEDSFGGPVPVMSETMMAGLVSPAATEAFSNPGAYQLPAATTWDYASLLATPSGARHIGHTVLKAGIDSALEKIDLKSSDNQDLEAQLGSELFSHISESLNSAANSVACSDTVSVENLDCVSVQRFEKQFDASASIGFGLGKVDAKTSVFALTQETYRARKLQRADLGEMHYVGVTVRLVVHAAIFGGDASGGIPAVAVKVDANQARANYRLDIEGYRLTKDVAQKIPTPGPLSAERYVEVVAKVDDLTRTILGDDEHILPRLFLTETLKRLSIEDVRRAASIIAVVRLIADNNNRLTAFGRLPDVDKGLLIDVYRTVGAIESDIPLPSDAGTENVAKEILDILQG